MRVAFIPPYYARDTPGGGWAEYMCSSLLGRGLVIEKVSLDRPQARVAYYKLKGRLYRGLGRGELDWAREPSVASVLARQASRQVDGSDVVLSSDSISASFLDCTQPVVLWLDATFERLVGFYPGYLHLCRETMRNGHALERAALERSRLALYSSEWAAESAVARYGLGSDRVAVVPWGASIDGVEDEARLKETVRERPRNECRLVFLGIDWHRKGGPFALDVVRELNAAGLRTQFTIVGCRPAIDASLTSSVDVLGFLDKRDEAQREHLRQVLTSAHFLLLPTRADCTPLAIHEAAAFGVPALVSCIAGIPESVKDDVSGKTFSRSAVPQEYARYVAAVLRDHDRYEEMALCAFREYQTRLNWTTASERAARWLRRALEP